MVTDPIADLLTRMRNAFNARQAKTLVTHSKVNLAILGVLKRYKFIEDFKEVKDGSFSKIQVYLNQGRNELNLKRISRPGQRIYVKKSEIMPVRNQYGISVLSTPKGVMSGRDAQKAGLGGEHICEVW